MYFSLMRNKRGFTMVELTYAVAIFSVVMMATTVAVIDIFHIYQRGIAVRLTQKNARLVSDAISKDASEAQAIFTGGAPGLPRICLQTNAKSSSKVIIYYLNDPAIFRVEVDNNPPGNCPSPAPASGTQMTTAEVTIKDFQGTTVITGKLADYQLTAVANSNLADYDPIAKQCAPAFSGTTGGAQFCSATTLQASEIARGEVNGG